jgi:hypothetical protein
MDVKKELGLVGAAPLSTQSGTIRIQKGDMLRENSSRKVLKVVNVYRKYEGGDYIVECEDMDPGSFGETKFVPIGDLSIMSW